MNDILSDFFESDICFNIRRTSKPLTNLYNRILLSMDCKLECTQYYLLIAIYRACNGNCLTKSVGIGTLSNMLLTDRTTVTRVIKPLVDIGMVEIIRKGRARNPVLTHSGKKEVEEIVPIFNEIDRYIKVEISHAGRLFSYSDFPKFIKKIFEVGNESAKIKWQEMEDFVCRFFNKEGEDDEE